MAKYIGKAMPISTFKIKQCKLAPTVTFLCTQNHCARKTILCARKSVHANIKFVIKLSSLVPACWSSSLSLIKSYIFLGLFPLVPCGKLRFLTLWFFDKLLLLIPVRSQFPLIIYWSFPHRIFQDSLFSHVDSVAYED